MVIGEKKAEAKMDKTDFDLTLADAAELKPTYQPPVLTELHVGETANGLIEGAPENNVTYS